MQMIRNKMVDSRKALDKEQARLSKLMEDPRKLLEGLEVTFAEDVPVSWSRT